MLRYEIRLTQVQLSALERLEPIYGNITEQIRTAVNNYLEEKALEPITSPTKHAKSNTKQKN